MFYMEYAQPVEKDHRGHPKSFIELVQYRQGFHVFKTPCKDINV